MKNCRNCKNCKEGTTEDAFWGSCYTYLCLKNNLYTNNPSNHTCDMHEVKKEERDYIIKKLELMKSGICVTLTDENNQWVSDIILSSWAAKDLRVGDKFRISYR